MKDTRKLYFFSYSYEKGNQAGFGNIEIIANPITTITDVKDIARQIQEYHGFTPGSVVILNFRRFEEGE